MFNKIFSGRQLYQSSASSCRWREIQFLKCCNSSTLWCSCRPDKTLLNIVSADAWNLFRPSNIHKNPKIFRNIYFVEILFLLFFGGNTKWWTKSMVTLGIWVCRTEITEWIIIFLHLWLVCKKASSSTWCRPSKRKSKVNFCIKK